MANSPDWDHPVREIVGGVVNGIHLVGSTIWLWLHFGEKPDHANWGSVIRTANWRRQQEKRAREYEREKERPPLL